jgi:hypothetical protein
MVGQIIVAKIKTCFAASRVGLVGSSEPKLSHTFCHPCLVAFVLLARRLPMLIIAKGRPPHFFKMQFDTSSSSSFGNLSAEQKILLKNNSRDVASDNR